MTFILNKCYGGFGISEFALNQLGVDHIFTFDNTDTELVNKLAALINKYGSEACSCSFSKLRVVEIPDCATDYEIDEYDGFETIIYVVNGKIHRA